MIQTGFESRVKIQQIIDSQLPEFILDESPKVVDFLRQYYISQEYQGGATDIVENLDQYLTIDNLTPEVVVGFTTLSSGISSTATTIQVSTTKGFPQNYGLFKINDEIITYTGLTTNTFTGCIRGFSGITSYHSDLNSEELVFSSSSSSEHVGLSTVQNLSSLFLQEFYKKIKYTLAPELENKNFVSNLNVGNFIKESRTLYESKGTDESFRILFNVLYGETPQIIDLEQFLAKPSSATYVRREVVVADVISGDPLKLEGQSLFKSNDITTSASISEVEIIRRKGKTYYKLLLFIGYDDAFPTITGSFGITGSSKNLEYISAGSSIISVDSTIGFPESGTIYANENIITYTSKSINQFFNCSGITVGIATASTVRSDEIYYGYEGGDVTKKVELRITGVLSGYQPISANAPAFVGDQIAVKNIGEVIENPDNNQSRKEIFANSWIYNTSSRFQIDTFIPNLSISQFTLKSDVDKSNLKVDDYIDILSRDSQDILFSNLKITQISGKQITTLGSFNLSPGNYDIRRRIKKSNSSSVPLEFNSITADIQNVYSENNEYMYVASNSLPSYQINQSIFSYNASGVDNLNSLTSLYSLVTFSSQVSFITGNEVYYKPSGSAIFGLTEGQYYVEVLPGNLQIRLYASQNLIGTSDYLSFGKFTSGTHNFTLYTQKENILSPQKILKKFPLSVNIGDGQSDLTKAGSIGMLINGVEIFSYKSNNRIYYGPLDAVNVLNGGSDYDVINPPLLSVSSGSALLEPVVTGSLKKVYVDPQEFDIDVLVSIALTGGNGSGAVFEPVIQRKRREIEFDARQSINGGGVDITNETITFLTDHYLINGQQIIYRPNGNSSLGVGSYQGLNIDSGNTLEEESTYYVKYISDTTIQLHESLSDYTLGINTVGFTTIGTSGIQKFATDAKNVLSEIKIINGGSGYTNRKLRVLPSGISTRTSTISYTNHGFNDGELVTYSSTDRTISGLSTSKQYYILKIDSDKFKLSDAGIGGTIRTNYERRKNVGLGSTGSGYHIFNYPKISLNVQYTSVGLGTTQSRGVINVTPIVRGKISEIYVYNNGSGYGSTTLNYHKKPTITVKNGKNAQFSPVISNGRIVDVSIQYSGSEYYSTPDIQVSGVGTGAVLRPVIYDNKITNLIIVNPGAGYSTSNTTITVIPAGKNAIFDSEVRSLDINNNVLYNNVSAGTTATNEIILSSYNNLQYAVCGYSQILQSEFKRYIGQIEYPDNGSQHSPIIGWAYDGNPIYGSYGYSDPKNTLSIKKLTSGYTLKPTKINDRPSGFPYGFFIDDYEFTNSGDLDECNGRFCVTPEFPNGIYAYFATSTIDSNNNIVGQFPYFIGNRYRSKFISDNKLLDQSFDFNNSNLIRNTFPYKVNDSYAGNDFIIESNEVINQITNIESVTSGSIDDFEIINSGDGYKVGDKLQFDENGTGGGGIIAQVSEIEGKEIVDLQTSITSYDDAIFTWKNGNQIEVKVFPRHSLENLDYVNISGFSTSISELNGFHQIGVTSYTSTLIKDIPAYTASGIVTDIYISNIPENISIGSSIAIESETLSVLNIFPIQNIVRVIRETTGTAHTQTTPVYFVPDTFTINKSVDYFDSYINDSVYFNPTQSVGVGTTVGIGIAVTNNIGIQTNNTISIPTQSIYLPNHPFKTNQKVTFRKLGSSNQISVANTSGSTPFNLPFSGDSQTVYIIKKSVDYIGIVTQIGLTTSTRGLFFISNGSDNYQYSFESDFAQVKGDIEKITTQVSVSTSHNLVSGDLINLLVKPNLSVGIGTSTAIRVSRDTSTGYILVNPVGFNSTGINTVTGNINIPLHNLNTGDKIIYTANRVASGLSTGFYYVYKIDANNIKLSETYIDCVRTLPPTTVSIADTGGSSQTISLVNPPISLIKNNNLVFDLSSSSLSGYKFKIFYDQTFNDEFISTGSTSVFSISGVGTVGVSTNASLTLNYNDEFPPQLFYALEKSGYISTADSEVVNYCQISFLDSNYQGIYNVSGVGTTTFNISLSKSPEKNLYNQTECNILKYTTSSTNTSGGVSKVRSTSPGNNFRSLPVFEGIDSTFGSGAYIIPKSNDIGKIKEIRIINEGFEYSSDKTLKPEALIPQFATIENSNTISNISIPDGGKNYTFAPDLVIVDSDTGEKINSGLLIANLSGNSIQSVTLEVDPVGLPENTVTIRSINNNNGVGIQTIQSSSSGIITCTLVTPLSGFSFEPFAIGDRIFVEGLQKEGTAGDGFNSENYGYRFFNVSNYSNAGTNLPRILEFSLAGLTTNPGIAKSTDNSYGVIINYNNYPKFDVIQNFSYFLAGEVLEVKTQIGFETVDLKIVSSNENYLKIIGTYDLQSNQIIRGTESGSLATINTIKKSSGYFSVGYASTQKIGWSDNIGKLNDDSQVIPDNDYYQNLSYSVKSNQEWSEIVSSVNGLLHPVGLKNFSDTQILESVGVSTTTVEDYTYSFYNITNENRIDTISNFDLVLDTNILDNSSRSLKFKNKRLADYIECKTNRVLEIDDISSEFSSSLQRSDLNTSSKIADIIPSRKYNKYLVQIISKDYSQIQFNEIIVLNNDSDIFTLEKGSINSGFSTEIGYTSNTIGNIYADVTSSGDFHLKFEPIDPYTTSYNIKYLNTTFSNYATGIGTTSIGFINISGVTSTVSSASTSIILQSQISKLKSVYAEINLIDNITNEINYAEVFVDHNGTDTNISEFYFDTENGSSSNFIGSFGASITGGVLTFDYTNTSSNPVTIRSKTVGFGTTAIGIGTYRFKQLGQLDGYENTVKYDSLYSVVSSASTIISFDISKFTSVKSTIRVGTGQTSALHQVMLIADNSNTYTTQYPFLSIGSTSGIGTFGGELVGSTASLKFYPDSSITGTFEILSFNESFFKDNDYYNVAPSLEYSNILESVGVKKYISINDNDINKLDFELTFQGTPIFMKTFDPSNSSIVNFSSGEFNIENHFFSTGEELIYRPNSSFIGIAASSVGIGSTLNHVGVVTNTLPQTLYAIKISNDKFKLATRKEYATTGIYVTFTSAGSGNAHELEMVKKNEKTIISVDNVIQSPIAYSLLNYTVNNGGQIGTASTTFGLSGISSIAIGDVMKIDDEYMNIVNVGFGTTYSGPISFAGTFPLISVQRGFLGSSISTHTNSGIASIYRGSFNIAKSNIYFTQAPKGSLDDQILENFDELPEARSYFNGRVFLKKDYTSNIVYDNISERFTGIGQTYNLTVGGANTVGLGTSGGNGIVLINGIYQTPSTQNNPSNNFEIIENSAAGISSIVFSGITSANGSIVISQSDLNMNQLPRGGIIVSLGSTPGLGYAPLVGASVTAIIGVGGSITSIGIGTTGNLNWGSGYRSPVSIAVTDSTHTGTPATITASVGAGGTLSFTIVNGGTGYNRPTINISPPTYSNLSVIGVSRLGIGATTDCGTGLLVNVDVGVSSVAGIGSTLFQITNFEVVRNGYNFKRGDVVKVVGLVTDYNLNSPISEFQLTILETFSDSFSAWQFGELDYIDSIKNLQNGIRTRFPLYYNSQLLSFEASSTEPDSQFIDFNQLLIIFVNGILQQSGIAYQFTGGTSFTFTEAPKAEDKVDIYFYRGSSDDSQSVDVFETIKPGDDLQVFSNNSNLGVTTTQNTRIVSGISTSDTLTTNLYTLQGVDGTNRKPVYWSKQKVDKIVDGELISKARDSIEPQIYPTAKIIKTITTSSSEIFVDDANFFNYEAITPTEFDALIISGIADPVSAAVTAIVSSAGTIQSLSINNAGSGYTGSSVVVKISSPPTSIVGFGTTLSVSIGTTATASISIVNGSLSTTTITNPGAGYTRSRPPQVIVPLPDVTYEIISQVTNVTGESGNILGIGTTVGIGTNLAINFKLSTVNGLSVGDPIYIFNTKVGQGVTSIGNEDSNVVGVGTTCLDNIYQISGINPSLGIITCNVRSSTSVVGLATTGSNVGNFSWGKFTGFSRSSSPISIGVSGFRINSGLTTFPTIQRRGYGLRNIGPIKKIL